MSGRGGRAIDYRYLNSRPKYLSNPIPILKFTHPDYLDTDDPDDVESLSSYNETVDKTNISNDDFHGFYSPLKDNQVLTNTSKKSKTIFLQRKLNVVYTMILIIS